MKHVSSMGLLRPFALAAMAAATLLSACSQDEELGGPNPIEDRAPLQVGLEVSRLDAQPGDRIAVGVVGQPQLGSLGAIQGVVSFDARKLRYVGQLADQQVATLVNSDGADRGSLAVVTVHLGGKALGARTSVLVVSLQGFVSLGSRGWRLVAAISKRRSVVTVRVRAIASDAEREADLEHHEYHVKMALPKSGSYSIRVLHEVVAADVSSDPLPHAVFEQMTKLV